MALQAQIGTLRADTDRYEFWISCYEICSVSQFLHLSMGNYIAPISQGSCEV